MNVWLGLRQLTGFGRRISKPFLFVACVAAVTACDAQPDITLPDQDGLSQFYPVGIHTFEGAISTHVVITRYSGKPMVIYLPAGEGPHPVVLFQHGRPFTMPSHRPYWPADELIVSTLANGYALAVSVRAGYFGDVRADDERIPCNKPSYGDFKYAGASAAENIDQAYRYLSKLSFIDHNRIVLAGQSAGGFASIATLDRLDATFAAVISINGGRCGKRGPATGGLKHLAKLYKEIAGQTTTPVYFLAGENDDVIPAHTTKQLYRAFCKARNDCAEQRTVKLIQSRSGTHQVRTMIGAYEEALQGS